MATASKKIETSPFLVRRVDVLHKLKTNKEWLEQSFKSIRDINTKEDEHFNYKEAAKWLQDNWGELLEFLNPDTNAEHINISGNWHENYAEGPRAILELQINLFDLPSYPYRNKELESNTNMQALNKTVKMAFMSGSDNKGNQTPSRYQKICQYVSLFEQSDEQFLDAKFYNDLPGLISDYKTQFDTVQQID